MTSPEANSISGTNYVFAPAGNYTLSVAGSGGDNQGDFDINNGHMVIVGTGAGKTVIDATTLAARDRVFETLEAGSLDLARVTLTGGQTTDDGGAIRVKNNTTVGVRELTLRDVAIVRNTATNATGNGNGGGLYLEPGAEAHMIRSVITDNTAQTTDDGGGGGIYAGGNLTVGAKVRLEQSIVADNTANNSMGNDLFRVPIAFFTSFGGNMFTSVAGSNFTTSGLLGSDLVSTDVDYIVTSVIDFTIGADDDWVLSLREAVNDAVGTPNAQTVWVPAWHHVLTKDDEGDMEIDFGHMKIVGSGAGSTIIDAGGLTTPDRIFETHGSGSLDLSRVTLTGGQTGNDGGAIRLNNNTTPTVRELTLTEVAIIGNKATNSNGNGNGGGIYFGLNTEGHIIRSVVSANSTQHTQTYNGGGGIYAAGTGTDASKVRLEQSIVAQNTTSNNNGNDLLSTPIAQFTSYGGNMFTSVTGSNLDPNVDPNSLLPTDHVSSSVDYVVTGIVDTFNHANDSLVRSLRDAIDTANTTSGMQEIWLPAWKFEMLITGNGGAEQGDLDIVSTIAIRGSGPGQTIIDGFSMTSDDRLFDITSGDTLDLSWVTLCLGESPNGSQADGGAIRVQNGGILNLDHSAIVGNATGSSGKGGAIYFNSTGRGSITNSVITVNESDDETGGVHLESASTMNSAHNVVVQNTIIANNTEGGMMGHDVFAGTHRSFTSGGNNRLGNETMGLAHGVNGDIVGSPDYIVTGLADTWDGTSDPIVMSLRDAIDLANQTSATDEIWLPAWDFILTQERTVFNVPEIDVAIGDLEVEQSLIILGVGTSFTSVQWRPDAVVDKVFELRGDYNGDGTVNAADYTVWQNTLHSTTDLRADGDDNGTVQQADYNVWYARIGFTLTLTGITVS
ncbi:MAG: hypothetical protein WD851_06365 [Pirellulales bacterium]